jgi:hypothetical protein
MNIIGIKFRKSDQTGDVRTLSPEKLAFDMGVPGAIPKVKYAAAVAIVTGSLGATTTIYTHSLGYIPFFLLYLEGFDISTGNKLVGSRFLTNSNPGGTTPFSPYATTTDIKVVQQVGVDDPATYNGFLYVFHDEVPA